MQHYVQQVNQTIQFLASQARRTVARIADVEYAPCGYKTDNTPPPADAFAPLDGSVRLGGRDRHFWLHFRCQAPVCQPFETPCLVIRTATNIDWDALNPQSLLYLNGEMVQGLDINHTEYPLTAGQTYDVHLYFYTGMYEQEHYDFSAEVALRDADAEGLYYDLRVPFEALDCFDPVQEEYAVIAKHLALAVNLVDLRDPGSDAYRESLHAARDYLRREFYEGVCGKSDAVVNCVGHTHIDVAWQWTYAQTREKAQRSFATVLSLMKRYPEYRFMSSQPQLYQFVKEEAPALYDGIRERVREGRFEPEGGMWVEADCNLTSGESLVRQLLFGKRFFRDEFGVDNKILWLPDVFGYTAALPQILRKSGIEYFVTSKISWNQYDRVPVDSFRWRGIDGSEIFTYFLTAQNYRRGEAPGTETTYVGNITPAMVRGTWERYQQKAYHNETILTYGFGDGGGGPTREMLEMQRRLAYGLPGLPRTQMTDAASFLRRARQAFDENCERLHETPTWVGELYLEMHRGTYTTAVWNKKNNRRAEFLYQNAEAAAVFDRLLHGTAYPQARLNDGWRGILLNQFHDVIPGSSIAEVYRDSDEMYRKILSDGEEMLQGSLGRLAAAVRTDKALLVYNPNGFSASGVVNGPDGRLLVEDVPSFGWKAIDPAKVTESLAVAAGKTAENRFYRMTVDDEGCVVSLYDKRCGREAVKPGERANRFVLFEDRPDCYDAWEISEYYTHKPYETGAATVTCFADDAGAGFLIEKRFGKSTLRQRITLYHTLERVDFETDVDWHEEHMLLKQFFPVAVNTDKATFDIQFGNLERPTHRNTSWDRARFEVCAQKWVDVSDGGYGVSLLNDCKYGYGVNGSTVGVTVLRAPTYPAAQIDRGESSYTVSLLPHAGSFRDAGTVRQAILLNNPLRALPASPGGDLPEQYAMLTCDRDNVTVETVKKCEDDGSIIVRLYECHNNPCTVSLRFGFDVAQVRLCDLMEEHPGAPLPLADNAVALPIGGFEILTLRVTAS